MKTVIELAEEAGFERLFKNNEDWVCFTEDIEALVELVRADEREAAEERVVTLYETCKTPYLLDITKAIRKQGVKDEPES